MMDKLKTYTDNRGSLTLVEEGHEIPFAITRAYWIYDVPAGEERGKHANKISYQLFYDDGRYFGSLERQQVAYPCLSHFYER